MSIVQRLDGSRVRKENNLKRRCRKIAACMVRNKIVIIVPDSGRERGWRETHVVGERFVIFSTRRCLALCALRSHSSEVVHVPCARKSKMSIFNKIGLA